ncbi:MAG: DNA-binding protein [Flavobacteriaceae bacterium]|nr:DNA-binding protein [Flavobacteriaceae bacterium]|tara:strand:+ start:2171 stop:2614 length:444 start_codon:yes stop_codon:yes gene_type:complete
MEEKKYNDAEDIYSKILRAGRRTYFFDVRSTKAGDYYLTISESKKFTNEDGSFYFKKHKIYLYKEDFQGFNDLVKEMTQYIIDEKGLEVISERHQKDYVKEDHQSKVEEKEDIEEVEKKEGVEKEEETKENKSSSEENFTDVDFDDI